MLNLASMDYILSKQIVPQVLQQIKTEFNMFKVPILP
jgi:hypothetical protein